MDDSRPAKRRLIQFSVGSMLLLMLLIAVCLGYLRQRAAEQRRVIGALEQLGLEVHYPWEVSGDDYFPMFPPNQPPASANWIGVEYLYQPVSVSMQDPAVCQQAKPYLQKLGGLKFIWVHANYEQLDDEWFKDLPDVELGFIEVPVLLEDTIQANGNPISCASPSKGDRQTKP